MCSLTLCSRLHVRFMASTMKSTTAIGFMLAVAVGFMLVNVHIAEAVRPLPYVVVPASELPDETSSVPVAYPASEDASSKRLLPEAEVGVFGCGVEGPHASGDFSISVSSNDVTVTGQRCHGDSDGSPSGYGSGASDDVQAPADEEAPELDS